jgi:hypothetical protein
LPAAFQISLHPDKTRLIEFGRFAANDRKLRGLGKRRHRASPHTKSTRSVRDDATIATPRVGFTAKLCRSTWANDSDLRACASIAA